MHAVRLFLLFCLLGHALVLPAQKVILSEAEPVNVNTDDFSVIGKLNDYLAVYRKTGELPEIILYSPYFRKYKTLSLPMVQAGFSRIYFSSAGNVLHVFFQQREQRQDKLYHVQVNADYSLSGTRLLAQIGPEDSDERILFDFSASEDGRYHALFAQYRNNGKKTIRAVVVGPDASEPTNLLYTPTDNDRELYGKALVSNKGHVFFMLSNRSTNKGFVDKLSLLHGEAGSNQMQEQVIQLGKHAVGDLQWATDAEQHRAYVGGCFSDGKFNEPKGVFFFRFDTDKRSDVLSHFTPLALLSDELGEMRLRRLNAKKDGGLEWVMEKYNQQVRTLNNMSPVVFGGGFMTTTLAERTRTVNEYNYNQIQLINLKSDGALHWVQTVLKDQQSTDDGGIFSSFGSVTHPLGNAYVFNELESRNNRMMVAYVNSESQLSIKEIQLDEDAERWSAMPRSAKQTGPGELVMPCVLKNYLCFLKISF
jgi:hypothetical protein